MSILKRVIVFILSIFVIGSYVYSTYEDFKQDCYNYVYSENIGQAEENQDIKYILTNLSYVKISVDKSTKPVQSIKNLKTLSSKIFKPPRIV